jgi:membrane associated rhomboid family serine protease
MKWRKAIQLPLYIIGSMWMIHIAQVIMGVRFIGLGVYPRKLEGAIGILSAPFIHGSFQHLISNSVPLFFLITLLFLAYRRSSWIALTLIYIGTGIGMWLFVRPSFHIGASGVVYGLVSFMFWTGVFRKNIRSIAISLAILFLYSGYIWGIFPGEPGVSWDGHLIGAIVGIMVAYLLRGQVEESEQIEEEQYTYLRDEAPKRKYFDSDLFD